tara:strand:+ start:257 stop:451 length:195 start_codon:yes stop_codon:yes gene_type:complete
MPWKVIKLANDKYQLEKLTDGTRPNMTFKTKESALKQGLNWMRYRKEEGVIKGNKILKIKKKDK